MSDTLMGIPIVYTDDLPPLKDNTIYLISLDGFLERQLWGELISGKLTVKFEGGKFAIYRKGREKPVGFIQATGANDGQGNY